MKPGSRALGVAESYPGTVRVPAGDSNEASFSTDSASTSDDAPDSPPESILCGAVVRADRVVDGL
ncbi:DUF99 domain-containing protein, partial [Enterococcus hirae]